MPDPTHDPTTLYIRVGDQERLRDAAEQRIKNAEDGKDVEDVSNRHILNIEDPKDLGRVLSPVNLELLRVLRTESPTSISAAAEAVDRDYKEVHRNLTELAALNIIRLEEDGRSKRPVLPYEEIKVDVPLGEDSDSEQTAAA